MSTKSIRKNDLNRLIDPQVLDSLEAHIGKDMLPLVVETFVNEGRKTLQQIDSSLDRDALQSLCHSLKSSSASLRGLRLSREAQRLCDLLRPESSGHERNELPDTSHLAALLKSSLIALNLHLI